jgi:hypothetical protein
MKGLIVRIAAVLAVLTAAGSAPAAFSVRFSVGNTMANPDIVIVSATNLITYSNNNLFGQYNLESFSATTNSPGGITVGGQFGAQIRQVTLNIIGLSGTPTALTITTSSDPFNIGTGGLYTVTNALAHSGLSDGAVADATTTITPGGTTPTATLVGTGIASNQRTTTADLASTNPFTLSNSLMLTGLTTNEQASLTLTSTAIQAVPAPSALLLVGLGVPAFGLIRRWTRKPAQPAVA